MRTSRYNEGLKIKCCDSNGAAIIHSSLQIKEGLVDNRILVIEDCYEGKKALFKACLSICPNGLGDCKSIDDYRKPVSANEEYILLTGKEYACGNSSDTSTSYILGPAEGQTLEQLHAVIIAIANNEQMFDNYNDATINGIVSGGAWVVTGNDPTFVHEAGTKVIQP